MSAFWEDEESPEPLDEGEVFDLVGDSLDHLHMSRTLEQITARGYTHHRRRAAVTAMAGVAAITALGAAVAFAQSGYTVRAVSTASGTVGVATSTAARMSDPDWTVTADPAGGYAVHIAALGDVDQLNATLKSLGVELDVVEAAPSAGSRSACPAVGGAASTMSIPATTGTATVTTTTSMSTTTSASSSPTQSIPATDDSGTESDPSTPSTAATSPDAPSPTPVSFGVSGTAAAFTFGDLPKGSAFSFISIDGRSRPLLGTVRISGECLPVFETRPS
jgi:hypothetical protein